MTATDSPATEIDCCTVASKNFLPQVRAMVRSYRAHHPAGRIFILLVDDDEEISDLTTASCRRIRITDLPIDSWPQMRMRYDVAELCAAVKPVLLRYLLTVYSAQHIVFLDPDLYFTGPMTGLPALMQRHEILLTPQIIAPYPANQVMPSEFSVIASGSLNGGFVGLRSGQAAFTFLDWWGARVEKYCFRRPQEQMFGDQRWLDLVPTMFDHVHIIRDCAYNIAVWNLHERPLSYKEGRFFVRDLPAAFFHMSGFRPGSPPTFCRHQHLFPLNETPALRTLSSLYHEALREGGYDAAATTEYGFDRFDNGVRISPIIRRIYESLGDEAEKFSDPLQTRGSSSFFSWLTTTVIRGPRHSSLLNLHVSLRALSAEAGLQFPTLTQKNAGKFGKWLSDEACRNDTFDLDPVFLRPLLPLRESSTMNLLTKRIGMFLRRRHTCAPYQLLCRTIKTVIGKRTYYMLKPSSAGIDQLIKPTSVPKRHAGGVTIVGCLQAENGIGEGLRGHINALRQVGVEVEGLNVRSAPGRQEERLPKIPLTRHISRDIALFVGSPDELPIILQSSGVGQGARLNIAHIAWELCVFPKRYLPLLRSFDEIWVPSRFTADSIGTVSPVPVFTVPYCIDTTPTQWKRRKDFHIGKMRFVFLYLFDYFSTIERKNPLQLIDAFWRAFGDDPSVLLVIKTSHGHAEPEARKRVLSAAAHTSNILVIEEYLTRPETLDLIRCCDCFVSLHRSEGFGMPMAEAMGLGKPVIATDYGGSKDFLDSTCGYPVTCRLTALATSVGPYDAGTHWADPNTEHAATLMREVYTNREQAAERAGHAAERIKDRYSIRAIGECMRQRLEFLAS